MTTDRTPCPACGVRHSSSMCPGERDEAFAIANLRHLYAQMTAGMCKDGSQAKRIATGLLGPSIEKLERAQAARRTPTVGAAEPFGYVTKDTRGAQWFYKTAPYLDTAVECVTVYATPPITREAVMPDISGLIAELWAMAQGNASISERCSAMEKHLRAVLAKNGKKKAGNP